ncbi:MAG: trehalose-6-phosphate synthase [Phycisphaeraceae bacterium]|nr:trehalose-6-phosphate synthase [Phycisphaeraceae bacterium]MCW5767825.1 trehalose-6-phosphate synthase [Phycisphaeraceae bacterium]
MAARRRLVVVANRLPIQRVPGESRWEISPGGLVAALRPVLDARGGTWVGWQGTTGKSMRPFTLGNLSIRPVPMSESEARCAYHGMSNETLWPLYHDAIRTPVFNEAWWHGYKRVNQRFARRAATSAAPGSLVWIHDYHLQLAPAMLRELRPDLRIGFFLHIPFTSRDIFSWLPWRSEILRGMLGSDVIGFQTDADADNFTRTARSHLGLPVRGSTIRVGRRNVRVRAHPISIDFGAFNALGKEPSVRQRAAQIRERLDTSRCIYLCVDRLDYTKGIDLRLRAFERLLRSGKISPENAVLVQIAVPTRDRSSEYGAQRATVEGLVGAINGEFSRLGRVPVHYFRRSLNHRELAAYYLAADVMLVTPLRDGMNLVAKEFVATRADGDGTLVLSEFAGAARELSDAYLVNPHDEQGTIATIAAALAENATERRRRMESLRAVVRRRDVYRWCDRFLEDLAP